MKINIGTNLKELLKREELSERELSIKTGVSQQTVNRLVTGVITNPKLDTLMPIAEFFGISLQDLVSKEENNLAQNIGLANQVPFVTIKEMKQFGLEQAVMNATKFISGVLETGKHNYYFATAMYDDSMEPRFSKGTILVFEKASQVVSGDFCLLKGDENHYVFRQILINGSSNKKLIKCLNPNYEEYSAFPLAVNYFILATLHEARMVFTS